MSQNSNDYDPLSQNEDMFAKPGAPTVTSLGSLAAIKAALHEKIEADPDSGGLLQWHDEPADPAQRKAEPFDPGCGRYASDIPGLRFFTLNGETPGDYVKREEGTYNPESGHFLCDTCYIKAGMPTGPNGWQCP